MNCTRPSLHRRLPIAVVIAVLSALLVAVPTTVSAQTNGFDGDPATTERLRAGDPIEAAIAVSEERFSDTAPYAVLATVETFADSLAGAALTDQGPLLLTESQTLSADSAAELSRVLEDGSTVYVLGGVDAIAGSVTEEVAASGFTVTRLAGASRIETAIAVADEVRSRHPDGQPAQTVLLARSDAADGNPTSAWADSVAGGALAASTGIPILVTPTDGAPACEDQSDPCPDAQLHVHPAVAQWLAEDTTADVVMLGGEAALTESVEDYLANSYAVTRLAGPERTSTAAAIADSDLWPRGGERRFVVLDGAREDGWAYGLSAAGISVDTASPPLMVSSVITPATRRLVSTCGDPDVDLLLAGDTSIITTAIEDQLTAYDGESCASDFAALTPFVDCTDTLAYFKNEALDRVTAYGLEDYYYPVDDIGVVDEEVGNTGGDPQPQPVAAPAAPGDSAGEDVAVSDTNVQEVGVDEPDGVKATAEAAYIVAGPTVQVMDLSADVPSGAATLELPQDSYRHELLLDGDVLMVLSSGDGYFYPEDVPQGVSVAPAYYFPQPTTTLTRFDITDRTAPTLIDTAELDGEYRSARMVDGVAHVVVSANPTGLDFVFPQDSSTGSHDAALAENRRVIQDSTIANWLPSITIGDDGGALVACDEVFAPPAFSGIATVAVASIDISESLVPTSSAGVIAQAETLYASTERLVLTSTQWGRWNNEAPVNTVSTEVHSFDITDSSATTYVASGQVEGTVLNSYSISELNGYYRIATTANPFEGSSDNGITILTEGGGDLFEVGRVFGLGRGEQIFAVRYLGDIAAVVTFRRVDPLYLVDLSNPAAPRVTGELKIPGVSRYLHPVGEDLLLGVGQDGTDDGRLTGLQVSLFDISDRAAPVRVDSIEYGVGDSPVEFDARAFLYWAALDRAFIPANLYGTQQFNGAVAVDVDQDGLTVRDVGRFQQPDDQFRPIERTFIVGDRVFGVSYDGVSAHDLESLETLGFAAFDQ